MWHVVVVILWNFNYIMIPSLIFVKFFGKIHVLRPLSLFSYPKSYVKEKVMNLFYQNKCVGGKKCDHCGNLTLFQNKYSIDINDQLLSNLKVKWKTRQYIHTSISSNNSTSVKMIDLQESEIHLIEFLKKFETYIYRYTKHSHRAWWKGPQFKKSHEIFSMEDHFLKSWFCKELHICCTKWNTEWILSF